jgi:SAM-dependent methyltransferase
VKQQKKMDSRELGLVLAQQLLGVDDLHYGLWEPDLPLRLDKLAEAQQRYNDMLFSVLPPPEGIRVLDIGCGTGHLLEQLLMRGYSVDGVIPAEGLLKVVRQRLDEHADADSRIFACKFEDFPDADHAQRYDVAIFSESYQYVPMEAAFSKLETVLKPGGMVVICDFFKTAAHGDGGLGDKSLGGGHCLAQFYGCVAERPLELLRDEDITAKVSPNFELLNDLLMNKIKPAGSTLKCYLEGRSPLLTRLLLWMARKKLRKANYKYFSGLRCKATFEKYKTYRLMVCRLSAGG